MHPRLQWPVCLLLLLTLLAACAGPAGDPTPSTRMRPAPAALGAHNDTSTPFNLSSVPALAAHRYDGRALRLDHVVARELAFTRYHVSYRSGDLTISGVMNVPTRRGRFPLLILAHGYRNPDDYRTGDGLTREQAHLAAAGYVVFQPDYRNFGGSELEGPWTVAQPLGYAEDLVNAVLAVDRADLPYVDESRVGVFGRSMGGGVTLNALAARPDLFDAAVLYAPVSSRAADNFDRWVRGRDGSDLEARVAATYGLPEDNPLFWSEASARTYLDRVDVPVQIHHGTADPICPVAWSRATADAFRRTGNPVRLYEYPGQVHGFDQAWPAMMRRSVEFLGEHLR
ncbi:MAG TPA: alpha/beta fold hydrolase [Nocardioidaceae bacterium]|nr:alpha/beta fold hydrolase [Nocardioidaceae bacterium]